MSSCLLVAGSILAATWIHGVTDKDPLSYTVGEPIVFTLKVMGDAPLSSGTTIPWKRSGDDGKNESGRHLDDVFVTIP